MSLELIATPIGDPGDITLRAIESLRSADVIIGEERKETSKLLRALGIEGKPLELLNEHTRDEDLAALVEMCRTRKVALVTDCGTPGFCDPGSRLVSLCRAQGLGSKPVPGASSLMCLLSVSGVYLREFLFRGFLPAEKEERGRALNELSREKRPVILMDTPYRLGRLLSELAERFPSRRVLLGCDFTQSTETVIEALARDLPALVGERKAEFILLMYPGDAGSADIAGRAVEERGPAPRSQEPRRDSREAKPTEAGGSSGSGASRPGASRPGSGKPGGRKFTPGRRR